MCKHGTLVNRQRKLEIEGLKKRAIEDDLLGRKGYEGFKLTG